MQEEFIKLIDSGNIRAFVAFCRQPYAKSSAPSHNIDQLMPSNVLIEALYCQPKNYWGMWRALYEIARPWQQIALVADVGWSTSLDTMAFAYIYAYNLLKFNIATSYNVLFGPKATLPALYYLLGRVGPVAPKILADVAANWPLGDKPSALGAMLRAVAAAIQNNMSINGVPSFNLIVLDQRYVTGQLPAEDTHMSPADYANYVAEYSVYLKFTKEYIADQNVKNTELLCDKTIEILRKTCDEKVAQTCLSFIRDVSKARSIFYDERLEEMRALITKFLAEMKAFADLTRARNAVDSINLPMPVPIIIPSTVVAVVPSPATVVPMTN
jgi:hypothetical protein